MSVGHLGGLMAMGVRGAIASAVGLVLLVVTASSAAADGTLTGDVPAGRGVALVQWRGGSIDALAEAAYAHGCELGSAWLTVGGRFVGFVVGAPDFANAGWLDVVGAELAATPLLLVCRTHGLDTCPKVSSGIVDYVPGPTGLASSREALDLGLEIFFSYPEGKFVEAEVSDTRVTWHLVAPDGVVIGEYLTERDEFGWRFTSVAVCSPGT